MDPLATPLRVQLDQVSDRLLAATRLDAAAQLGACVSEQRLLAGLIQLPSSGRGIIGREQREHLRVEANERTDQVGLVGQFILLGEDGEPRELLEPGGDPAPSPNEVVLDDLVVHVSRHVVHVRVCARVVASLVVLEDRGRLAELLCEVLPDPRSLSLGLHGFAFAQGIGLAARAVGQGPVAAGVHCSVLDGLVSGQGSPRLNPGGGLEPLNGAVGGGRPWLEDDLRDGFLGDVRHSPLLLGPRSLTVLPDFLQVHRVAATRSGGPDRLRQVVVDAAALALGHGGLRLLPLLAEACGRVPQRAGLSQGPRGQGVGVFGACRHNMIEEVSRARLLELDDGWRRETLVLGLVQVPDAVVLVREDLFAGGSA